MSYNLTGLRNKFDARVGFVTTPKYFDDAVQEFLKVAPERTGVMQRVITLDGYSYGLDQRVVGMQEMERSALALAESHCDVVLQVGTNWVHAAGTTPPEIVEKMDRISGHIGKPFRMSGHAIVDALNRLGAKRIAVTNGYYRDDWRDGINRYLTQAGFDIATSGSLKDQGILEDLDEMMAVEAATLWDYPPDLVRAAVVTAYEQAPDVDAVVQTGAGFRTIDLLADIEAEIGVPVVPSDGATYWAGLDILGLHAKPGFGTLLESTRAE